ncbi:MAG: polyketide synthase [Cyanobacteria bacterium RYN_339]|nr:polyketide synthase [Cyanobacteria bacterium RYN_339]
MSARIAIVGFGSRLPGQAPGPQGFWPVLADGVDTTADVPADRFDIGRLHAPEPKQKGKIVSRRGAFVAGDLAAFDAGYFGLAPRECKAMDPQQRMLLEAAVHALADAGIPQAELRGSKTAVYVGTFNSDYETLGYTGGENVDLYTVLGGGRYSLANRISFFFDFRGPSMHVDTACSSTAAAFHLACEHLRGNPGATALVGGCNLLVNPHLNIGLSYSGVLSPSGQCRFGDASADGYIRGEAIGMIVLKRLDDALRDGNRIYAVVRASGMNHDGASNGLLIQPSEVTQVQLMHEVWQAAGITADDLDYIEAHGTGTRVGDPIELQAFGAALAGRTQATPCYVGSVKSNVGHSEGASAFASILKVALSLGHGVIPPSLHFRTPHPGVDWERLPITINTAPVPWPRHDRPRLAAMNSFGMTGTNVHLVFEAFEAPTQPTAPAAAYLLPVSARSEAALRASLGDYRAFLLEGREDLADVCHSAGPRGTHQPYRVALAGRDAAELVAELDRVASAPVLPAREPRIAFVYAGQGSAWAGMARELLEQDARFAGAVAEVSAACGWSVADELRREPADSRLADTLVAQLCIFAVQLGLTRMLAHAGILPAAVVGHSLGEVTAAHVAGALGVPEAVALIQARGEIMRRDEVRGRMAAVALDEAACTALLARHGDPTLAIAAVNSPTQCVVSGPEAEMASWLEACGREGVGTRDLDVAFAFHSTLLAPFRAELAGRLAPPPPGPAAAAFYSTVQGGPVPLEALDAHYWAANMCDPVRFLPAATRLLADGYDLLVELAPHPALAASLDELARGLGRADVAVVPTLRKGDAPARCMARALGRLYAAGAPLAWAAVTPPGRTVSLPPYPFQRERYWLDAKPAAPDGLAEDLARLAGELDGIRAKLAAPAPKAAFQGWLHELTWVEEPASPAESGRWLVLAADEEEARAAFPDAIVAGPTFDADALEAYTALLAGVEGITHVVDLRPAAGVGPEGWLAAHERNGARTLLAVQALLASGGDAAYWLVTRGALGLDAPPCLGQAALVGLARSLALECAERWGGHVDLPAAGLAGLREAIAGGRNEIGVALRAGRRLVARVVPAATGVTAPLRCAADASYLITGGLGHIGLVLAEHLARAGARELVLASRSGAAHPAAEAAIARFAAQGVRLHVVAADLADPAAAAALGRYLQTACRPLKGVIHGAGTYADHPIAGLDRTILAAEAAPKVQGAWHLHELTRNVPLDFFVMMSSISAVWGSAGQAPYAAGNAFLDALALHRRALGLPGTSINWGMWADGGMATAAIAERFGRMGIRPMAPELAVQALDAALAAGRTGLVVAAMDWDRFAALYRSRRPYRLFERLAADAAPVPTVSTPKDPMALIAAVLGATPAALDLDQSFANLGLDSLMAVELAGNLAAAGIPTTLAELLTAPSVRHWVDGRGKRDAIVPAELPVAPPPTPAARPAPAPKRDARTTTWLHTFDVRPEARVRVVAFPYAGGGPSVYGQWPAGLDPAIELSSIILPGRAHRLEEPPFRRMDALVAQLAPALAPLFDREVVFTGHCLGALIMFEVAHWLRQHAGVQPAHLLVSGARAPSFYRPEQLEIDVMQFSPVAGVPGHDLGEQDFLTFLADLNFGTSAALFGSPEMRKLMLPTVQADLETNNLYTYGPRPPLDIPITVVGGRVDPYVTGNHLVGWRALTSGPSAIHMRPGDHYFIETERAFLVDLLGETAMLGIRAACTSKP